MHISPKIRKKDLILYSSVLLVLGLFSFILYFYVRSILIENSTKILEQQLLQTQEHMDTYFKARKRELNMWSKFALFKDALLEKDDKHLYTEEVKNNLYILGTDNPYYDALFIIDEKNKVFSSNTASSSLRKNIIKNASLYKGDFRDVTIHEVILDNEPIVFGFSSIYNGKKKIGVLGVTFHVFSSIDPFLWNIKMDKKEVAFIIQSSGDVISQKYDVEKKDGIKFLELLGNKKRFVGEIGDRIVFLFKLNQLNWVLGTSLEKSEIVSSQIHNIILIFSIVAIMGGLLFIFIIYFVNKSSEKLDNMSTLIDKKTEEITALHTNVDKIVEDRTFSLQENMKKISDLLDNMELGVFTILDTGEVVAPVSKHSVLLFGYDIVGSNIFDFIYKSIDSQSELYSLIKTSLVGSFGSDEVQWILLQDNFPKKVHYQHNGVTRIIGLSYGPIWNEKHTLEKIMFIAEDITEMDFLEKEVAKQKIENEQRMQILQELAAQDPNDLKRFFNETFRLIDSSFVSIKKLKEHQNLIGEIFRNLHTIKGNSRVLGLNIISQVAHAVESLVIDIRSSDNAIKVCSDDEIKTIENSFERILKIIQEYSAYAENLLKIENEYRTKSISGLSDKIVNIEWLLNIAKSIAREEKHGYNFKEVGGTDQYYDKIYEMIKIVLNDCDEYVRRVGIESITQGINELKIDFLNRHEKDSFITTNYLKIASSIKYLYVHSPLFKPYELDLASWNNLIFYAYKVSVEFLNKNSDNEVFMAILRNAQEEMKNTRYLFPEKIFMFMQTLMNNELELPSEIEKRMMRKSILRLWQHISLVSQLNIFLLFSMKDNISFYDEFKNVLKNDIMDINDENCPFLSKSIGSGCVITSALKFIMIEDNVSLLYIFDIFSKVHELKNIDYVVEYFIPRRESCDVDINKMFFSVLEGEIDGRLIDYITSISKISNVSNYWQTDIDFLKRNRYLYTLEFLKFAGGHVSEEKLLSKSVTTIDVVDKNIYKLKDFIIHELPKLTNSKGYIELYKLSQKLFDVPIKPSLARYFPMIKELSLQLGKKIIFKVEGVDLMINRSKLPLITDSITHILRNAIDHGIETIEERLLCSKVEFGTIRVILSEVDESVVIEIKDDGKGIDIDKLQEKALEKGLVTYEELEKMMSQDVLNLIFISGLSTKDTATDISGRGIGMDVVKSNIEKIGGTVSIATELGKGTTFTLQLKIF